MERHFIVDGEFPRLIGRGRAFGYKELNLENIEFGQAIEFKTDEAQLCLYGNKAEETESPAYTILCKEFGVFGGSKNFESKISVVHCDDGWMLVTLWKGALIIKLDGKLMMPSTGVDEVPNVIESEILWVNRDTILSFAKYLDDKSGFMYDFEFMYTIKGFISSGMKHLKLRHIDDEDVDISLGQFAAFLTKQAQKQQAKETKKLCKSFNFGSSQDLEFDDEDEDEYEDDEDDDYYDDDDDY